MNDLQIFKSSEFGEVRVIEKDGESWFVAKDVCRILEIVNNRDAVSRLGEKMKGVATTDTLGGRQEVQVISESGVYKLVFTSRMPEAEKFTDWLAFEVIPAIRKTGTYNLVPKSYAEALRELATTVEQKELLEAENQKMLPKAEFFDAVADSKDAIEIGQAAKVLNTGIGRNRLFVFLREQKVLMTDNIPYQEYVDRGYFRIVEQKYTTPKGETRINIKTLVHQKGLDFIRRKLEGSIAG